MPELLTLKQLAQHLQVSERTVFRLLERGELPGVKVGGHWRFRQGVVDYWLDIRMGRMEGLDLLDANSRQEGGPLPLSDALTQENALLRIPAGSRRDIVEAFVGAVRLPESVSPREVLRRVWAREELSSTALAEGAALLHTSRWESRTLGQGNLLAIGVLAEPVDFGAVDGQPTDILILLLAGTTAQQLSLLARTTRLCRQQGFLARLRLAASPGEVVALVRRTEGIGLTSGATRC